MAHEPRGPLHFLDLPEDPPPCDLALEELAHGLTLLRALIHTHLEAGVPIDAACAWYEEAVHALMARATAACLPSGRELAQSAP